MAFSDAETKRAFASAFKTFPTLEAERLILSEIMPEEPSNTTGNNDPHWTSPTDRLGNSDWKRSLRIRRAVSFNMPTKRGRRSSLCASGYGSNRISSGKAAQSRTSRL